MAGGAGGIATIPFYATVFRADKLETALAEIAPVALRYGAIDYQVFRWRDDRYRFMLTAEFPRATDFDAYWYGEEFVAWRADYSSWYQVPVVYAWADRTIAGRMGEQPTGRTGIAAI